MITPFSILINTPVFYKIHQSSTKYISVSKKTMSLVGLQRRCGACCQYGHARHNIRCPYQPWNIGFEVSPNTFQSVIKSRRYRWRVDNGISTQRQPQQINIIENHQENINTTNTNTTNTIIQLINTLQNSINTLINIIPDDFIYVGESTVGPSSEIRNIISDASDSNDESVGVELQAPEEPPEEINWHWVHNIETGEDERWSNAPSAPQRQLEDPIIVTRQNDKTEAVTRIMTMVEENMLGMNDQAYKNIMEHLGSEYNT